MNTTITEKIKKALEDDDIETLRYLLSFQQEFRALEMNVKTYEQFLKCGFTDKPTFDENGWLTNNKEMLKTMETKVIFEEDGKLLKLYLLELPNKKWITGISMMLHDCGTGGYPSVWGKQFDSKEIAIEHNLTNVIKNMKVRNITSEKKYIAILKAHIAECRQLSLF